MSQATTADSLAHLDPRDARALTQSMTAIPIRDAPGMFDVVTATGQYRVDVRTQSCECDDARYRDPDGGCKHARRVEFATGERAIPEWADRDQVDPQLGEQIDLGTEFNL